MEADRLNRFLREKPENIEEFANDIFNHFTENSSLLKVETIYGYSNLEKKFHDDITRSFKDPSVIQDALQDADKDFLKTFKKNKRREKNFPGKKDPSVLQGSLQDVYNDFFDKYMKKSEKSIKHFENEEPVNTKDFLDCLKEKIKERAVYYSDPGHQNKMFAEYYIDSILPLNNTAFSETIINTDIAEGTMETDTAEENLKDLTKKYIEMLEQRTGYKSIEPANTEHTQIESGKEEQEQSPEQILETAKNIFDKFEQAGLDDLKDMEQKQLETAKKVEKLEALFDTTNYGHIDMGSGIKYEYFKSPDRITFFDTTFAAVVSNSGKKEEVLAIKGSNINAGAVIKDISENFNIEGRQNDYVHQISFIECRQKLYEYVVRQRENGSQIYKDLTFEDNGSSLKHLDSQNIELKKDIAQKQLETAKKAGYVQGVCECVAAIGEDHILGKKLLTEMNVTKDMAKKFASPETYKALEQGIFAPRQKLEQSQSIKR